MVWRSDVPTKQFVPKSLSLEIKKGAQEITQKQLKIKWNKNFKLSTIHKQRQIAKFVL